MVIEHHNLSNGTGVLELQDGFLFDAKDDHITTPNTDSTCALANSFEGILNLKQVTIRREDSKCAIV
jgi:hypothetical protein